MNLKDYKIKDYSIDTFRTFADAVGTRLGISDSRDYKKYVEESCKDISEALQKFKLEIPKNEEERYKCQSSFRSFDGTRVIELRVQYFEGFMNSLNNFIKTYEDACVKLVMPLKISKSRSIFRKIFSKNKKQPEITPSERDYLFATLLRLKREAHRKANSFFDDVYGCSYCENLMSVMPQREGNNDVWDLGSFTYGSEKYKVPETRGKFSKVGSSKNFLVDTKNKCYYLRDDAGKLWKIGRDGNIISVVSQGSFGEPLNEVINRYEKFFDF